MLVSAFAGNVYRRGLSLASESPEYELPSWTPVVLLVDLIIFLPLWVFIGYTLHFVFPVLAVVEDENSPSYQPLATTGEAGDAGKADPLPTKTDGSARAVTSSLRLTSRLLRSQTGGPRAYFRGLPACLFYGAALAFLHVVFAAMLPHPIKPLATLIAALSLVQFRAAWVHIVMTAPSPLPFWRRLPPFKRAFQATAAPTALVWLVNVVGTAVPMFVVGCFDFTVPQTHDNVDPSMIWKSLVVLLAVLVQIFVVIPSEVILTRVQASLLPEEHETIVPFDRSFQGTVEPAVVSGKGYASIKDAWGTFSRQAWRRFVILYVKITGVSIAASAVMALVIVPQIYLIVANSTERNP